MKQRFARGGSRRDPVLLCQRRHFADCRAEQRGIVGCYLVSLIFRRLLHNVTNNVVVQKYFFNRVLKNYCEARYLSASNAAMQPVPALVTA
jgi:hypothetical protein